MKVRVIKQYSVLLKNEPGALAGLAKLFADKGVNVVGISTEVRDDSGVVRVALDAAGDLHGVLSRGGFASVESKLLSIELEDKAGQLHRVTRLLADGGVNITNVYGTSLGHANCRILIAAENTDKALKLLEKAA